MYTVDVVISDQTELGAGGVWLNNFPLYAFLEMSGVFENFVNLIFISST